MDYTWLILIVMVCLLIGIIVFILMDRKKYKHKVEIRELSNGRKLIIHDVAKDFTDQDGGNFWRLKREKDWVKKFLSVPPMNSIELDHKGNKCVTLYRDETGSYQYMIDNVESLGDERDIQPLKTNHRITMIDNFKKAMERGAGQFWKKYGLAVGAGMIIVVLFVAILAFWGEIAKPVIEINKQHEATTLLWEKIVNKLDSMDRNIQEIGGESSPSVAPPN